MKKKPKIEWTEINKAAEMILSEGARRVDVAWEHGTAKVYRLTGKTPVRIDLTVETEEKK